MDLDRFGLGGSVDVLDLSRIDADLRGFAGAAVVGRFAIIVPYKNRDVEDGYFGKVVKIDLETFAVVAVLDLTQYAVRSKTSDVAGANLVGFVGGIAWGKYAVLVPHRNAKRLPKNNMRPHSALAVRIDVEDFTLSGVAVIDLAHVERQQVPSQPDNELRGFLHGFAQGEYLYLVPHFSRDFYGTLLHRQSEDGFRCTLGYQPEELLGGHAATLLEAGPAGPRLPEALGDSAASFRRRGQRDAGFLSKKVGFGTSSKNPCHGGRRQRTGE
ncbi:hypothetical protein M885DRAFT_16073 [Pelagophyceae sp. CCMP2097]|nr:hypothetical protein M885DRAFT_16073 [Pelagophyceae sp. CCMP2097]